VESTEKARSEVGCRAFCINSAKLPHMMYFIGGAPRLGKSILATKLLNDRGISWLSTDALCATRRGADMQFSNVMHLETAQIVQRQFNSAHMMAETLRQFIEKQLKTQDDFTLEGVHLLPTLVGHIQKIRPTEVKNVFVVSTDKNLALLGLRADMREENWMRGASEEMQSAMADFVVGYSKEIKRQAEEEGLAVFERTENFQKDVEAMMRLLQ